MERRLPIERLVAIVAVMMVAACSNVLNVIETFPVDYAGSLSNPPCHSALGHYFLPKALLKITAKADPSRSTATITSPSVFIVPNRDTLFCLDYLSSSTSKDGVTVNRNDKGLLVSISSSVEDRTPQIATTLIQTAENLAIAAARGQNIPQQLDQADLQFDPFSWNDMLLVKAALRRFGFCLYVEGFSFPTGALNAAEIRAAGKVWCSTEPSRTIPYENPLYRFANSQVPSELMHVGVLYRPMMTYNVVILFKKDPGSVSSPWELYQTKRIEMPNASPVLAIGVERAMFAKRITTVNFNDGTLTDVALDKDSEAAGFVQIPLIAAQAIVDIPRQILTLRLTDVQNHAALIQAQGALLTAIANYNSTVSKTGASTGPGGALKSTNIRSDEFVRCLNAGGGEAACRNLQQRGQ